MSDPVDARLLSLLAELGRAAVHEVAARMGMDPREVAWRLVALSGSGLPLVVGVECDPNGLRAALSTAHAGYPPQGNPYGPPSGPYPAPSGPHPVYAPPSGPQGVYGTPSGAYPPPGVPSGPHPVYGTPSGAYPGPPPHGGPSGGPSGPYPYPGPPQQQQRINPPSAPFPAQQVGPPSAPFPAQQPAQVQPPAPAPPPDPVLSTWGPPQTASWARGDQPPQRPAGPPQEQPTPRAVPGPQTPSPVRTGKVGTTLEIDGLEGERLGVQLVEVVDPADYLFTAAGYRLQEGERSVVVHTELTNRGAVPFSSLPDLYLVLVTPDGRTISKAPVSLSSRPPHRIGVAPGETAGGHTVYVLPEDLEVTSVRWSPRPDDEKRTLTWTVEP